MPFLPDDWLTVLRENPTDAPRLALSDFLEERGDPPSVARAELIRVQIEQSDALPGRAAELAGRADALIAEWAEDWLEGWFDAFPAFTFRRGLVEAISADADVFLECAEDWFARWPTLSAVRLTRASGHLPALAASPWLAHLRALDLAGNDLESDELAYLAASPHLCLLEALDLSDNPIGRDGAARLACASHADELGELLLAGCGLGDGGVAALVSGPRARQWRRLDLSRNGLSGVGVATLARSPVLRGLVCLDASENPLGEGGIVPVAQSPDAAGLAELALCDTELGDEGLAAVANSPHLKRLWALDIRGHQCTFRWGDRSWVLGEGLAVLCDSPLLGRLRRLLLARGFAHRENGRRPSGWAADALRLTRPPNRPVLIRDSLTSEILRASPHLVPSRLEECDIEEIWWLGHTSGRERVPTAW